MNPDDEIALNCREMARAQLARDVLDNELYVDAFVKVRGRLVKAWEDSPARDTEAREKIWTTLKLLEQLKGELETVIETGKLAEYSIAQRARRAANAAKAAFFEEQ